MHTEKRGFKGTEDDNLTHKTEHSFGYGILRRRKPIAFVKAGELAGTSEGSAQKRRVEKSSGKDVADFYRSMMGNKHSTDQALNTLYFAQQQTGAEMDGTVGAPLEHANLENDESSEGEWVEEDLEETASVTPSEMLMVSASTFVCPTCNTDVNRADVTLHNTSIAHLSRLKHSQALLNPLHIKPSSFGYKQLVAAGWSPFQPQGIGAEGREGQREPVKVKVKTDTMGVGVKVLPKGDVEVPKPGTLDGRAIRKMHEAEQKKRKRLMDYMHSA
ncbi:hypothetical protein SAICODRAFT_6671 [Saitoella complicata NRRL Y-17804]|nr:uncharacterized protein SAICODRAFT_6671 [Saitoella complicata NRRL Y-17804]ODQ53888.1 hypothetical protein SAICODRAFT_6671 [Saitoella complicata NRRL Y-17804]